jgi:hypothetical protein
MEFTMSSAYCVIEKSDALVGRVNTFIILHTKSFKIAFKIWRPSILQILKVSFFILSRNLYVRYS